MLEGNLQAEADAEHRTAAMYHLVERLIQPAFGQRTHRTTGGTHTRKYDPLCVSQSVRVGADFCVEANFPAGPLHAVQIARIVVDDESFLS